MPPPLKQVALSEKAPTLRAFILHLSLKHGHTRSYFLPVALMPVMMLIPTSTRVVLGPIMCYVSVFTVNPDLIRV